MSTDQLLHISSTSFFLGFWVYALALCFYIAHAIVPEAAGAQVHVGRGGTVALAQHEPLLTRYRLGVTATGLAYLGIALSTLGLGLRWAAQGYWPVANAFEA